MVPIIPYERFRVQALTWNHTVVHAGDWRADGAIAVRRRSVVSTVASKGRTIVRVATKLAGRSNRLFISLYYRRLGLMDEKVRMRTEQL